MADPDIHERLIAWLEELHDRADYRIAEVVIDMAIDNVRRKCPRCEDKGFYYRSGRKHALKEDCDCTRPALLAEWEKKLGGKG